MRTLRVIFVLSTLHLAGSSLLAQSSQRANLLSLRDHTPAELLPDTLTSALQPLSSTSVLSPTFTFYQKENTILLHLRDSDNQISLRVADSIGNVVQLIERKGLGVGFYEFTLFKEPARSGLYTVHLVVNKQMSTFQAFP